MNRPIIDDLLDEYAIAKEDCDAIKLIAPLVTENKEQLADHHYAHISTKENLARFFKNEETLKRARSAFYGWLDMLVSGKYDYSYYLRLNKIGATHVRIGLATHHVNVAMSHLRNHLIRLIEEEFESNPGSAKVIINSLNKLLDLNLDIMTRSHRDEELRSKFLSYRLDSTVLSMAAWFVNAFNMTMVAGLVAIGILVLALSAHEVSTLFDGASVEKSILSALGSLLILWVIIELLDTQIRHMKGSAFAIKVFVSVALVAELRHVLVLSIEHGTWQDEIPLAILVLVLGVIYWLVSRLEEK